MVAVVVKRPLTRHSPAGIPLTRFVVEHESRQIEAGMMRQVRCRLQVVAAGEALQAQVSALAEGAKVSLTGFLNRAGYRSDEASLVLHAQSIELLND